jgi:ApaG protein
MAAEEDNLISVIVDTRYLEDQSDPDERRYVFAYTITIRNRGKTPARLLGRHWVITDANGKVQEVRGEGVVGEQPHLMPGQGFRYTSGAVLETPVGSMHGAYQMLSDSGERFEAPVAPFSLAIPGTIH